MTITIAARAVLLDMDGTLVDSTAVVERLWLEWSRPHGLDEERVLRTVHGRQGQESMALLLPERDTSVNVRENAEMLRRESEDVDGVFAIPGAAELLRALEPFPHAIVTSADVRLMRARMTAAGLAVPDRAVTAEDVARSKPDPEGFLKAAADLGVEPGACVVFEDSAAGIAAGRAAGMIVVGVGADAAGFGPTHHVADLTAVHVRPAEVGFELRLD